MHQQTAQGQPQRDPRSLAQWTCSSGSFALGMGLGRAQEVMVTGSGCDTGAWDGLVAGHILQSSSTRIRCAHDCTSLVVVVAHMHTWYVIRVTHKHVCTRVRAHIHLLVHAYIHTRTHARTHARTHTHSLKLRALLHEAHTTPGRAPRARQPPPRCAGHVCRSSVVSEEGARGGGGAHFGGFGAWRGGMAHGKAGGGVGADEMHGGGWGGGG